MVVLLHIINKIQKEVIVVKKNKILALVATLATLFATTVASSACWYFLYQPEEPKCLSEK